MTVKEIWRIRNLILTIGFIFVVALMYYLQNIWSLIIFTAFCIAWFFLQRYYRNRAYQRLVHIACDLLDPDLLDKENERFMRLLGSRDWGFWQEIAMLSFYSKGSFQEALAQCKLFRAKSAGARCHLNSLKFLFSLRDGKPEEAMRLLESEAKETDDIFRKRGISTDIQRMGLFNLETGNLQTARQLLEKSMAIFTPNNYQLSLHFDLARLEEKEGNLGKAIESYRQAAAIGPKTWMGQESARKAEALRQQLNNGNPNDEAEQA